MWKVSWLYEKVHNIANFGGYATILFAKDCSYWYPALCFTAFFCFSVHFIKADKVSLG